MSNPKKTKPKQPATQPETELHDLLKEYLNSIEENVKGNPFQIAYAAIVGDLLSYGDSDYQKIVRDHIFKCNKICDTPQLYKQLGDNGGDLTEVPLIRLASKFRLSAGLKDILAPYVLAELRNCLFEAATEKK